MSGRLLPLMEYARQLGVQYTCYRWESDLKALGLTKEHDTEISRLATSIEDRAWDRTATHLSTCMPQALDELAASARACNKQQRSRLLHCHLQLELLWALNWTLYLLGIL